MERGAWFFDHSPGRFDSRRLHLKRDLLGVSETTIELPSPARGQRRLDKRVS
jgi:hypothetical protein